MKLPLCFFIILLPIGLTAQYVIRGSVDLDSTWERKVYLSLIPDLEDIHLCSEQLIIAQADIQSDGSFTLRGKVFPDQAHLVRIHVSKKGDPPATLVIGGKEENHCFLALSNDSDLQLEKATTGLFDHFEIPGDPRNRALYFVDSLRQYFTVIDTAFSSLAYKEMVQEERAETLLNYADTCRFLLPSLYAIYHADWGTNRQQVQQARTRIAERFPPHPYLRDTMQKADQGTGRVSLWGGLFLLLAVITAVLAFVRRRPPSGFKELSFQEKKILAFLHEGKTNKEIAGRLHIEPSTVKSHVYNIYQKLEISSRKEVGKFGRWIEKGME